MQPRLCIHGGAGTISRAELTPEKEVIYHLGLEMALLAGKKVLETGGSAVDAVVASVVSLENFEWFNAGKGSVFTANGKHEMDSSLMCGKTGNAGAVAGISNIKNPVLLAQAVKDKTEHVLLMGSGAMEFAKSVGFELEPDSYFYTENRYNQLLEARKEGRVQLDHAAKKGTVGAVAIDSFGNLAASTSTGGMTNKMYGRVGDSPIIGAGTYANNDSCAISCTGHGEIFMKQVVAYDIHCLMVYKNLTLKEACQLVVKDKLVKAGGEGGLIAIDKNGNYDMVFNSAGMYRGCWGGSELTVSIF